MTTLAVSGALLLLILVPLLVACLYVVRHEEPDAQERAVGDVQDFIGLRERARAELAATGSLDRFIATKDEARKHLSPTRRAEFGERG